MREHVRKQYEAYANYAKVDDPLHVGWSTEEEQHVRFRVLLDLAGPLDGLTIHDAGCGLGAIVPHLPLGLGRYIGSDGYAPNLEFARRAHVADNISFIPLDLEWDSIPASDVTLVSGTLAFYSQKAAFGLIRKLYAATSTLVFNILVDNVGPGHTAHALPDVLAFCLTLSKRVRHRTGYLPSDASFSVVRP